MSYDGQYTSEWVDGQDHPDGFWGWVPNGCGEPNMYHQGFKCNVTRATATNPLAIAKPPVWCEDDPSKCTKGAKQMIYWNQLDGNNIKVSGQDLSGQPKSPAYNQKLGFPDGKYIPCFGVISDIMLMISSGAQNDIFTSPSQGGTSSVSFTTSTPAVQSPTATSTPSPTNNSTEYTIQSTPKRPVQKVRSSVAAYHRRRRIDTNSW
ncbi:hypothetical protein H0H87_005575 [Tephrocybe sp. NHM501043]|nr:hypothetical protein H0H87_005575 [Tephrocybe sp. NHM501043]